MFKTNITVERSKLKKLKSYRHPLRGWGSTPPQKKKCTLLFFDFKTVFVICSRCCLYFGKFGVGNRILEVKIYLGSYLGPHRNIFYHKQAFLLLGGACPEMYQKNLCAKGTTPPLCTFLGWGDLIEV